MLLYVKRKDKYCDIAILVYYEKQQRQSLFDLVLFKKGSSLYPVSRFFPVWLFTKLQHQRHITANTESSQVTPFH